MVKGLNICVFYGHLKAPIDVSVEKFNLFLLIVEAS